MDRRPEMTPPEITALYERVVQTRRCWAPSRRFVLFFAITIIRMS